MSPYKFNSRSEQAKETTTELENKSIEIIQEQKDKNMK